MCIEIEDADSWRCFVACAQVTSQTFERSECNLVPAAQGDGHMTFGKDTGQMVRELVLRRLQTIGGITGLRSDVARVEYVAALAHRLIAQHGTNGGRPLAGSGPAQVALYSGDAGRYGKHHAWGRVVVAGPAHLMPKVSRGPLGRIAAVFPLDHVCRTMHDL